MMPVISTPMEDCLDHEPPWAVAAGTQVFAAAITFIEPPQGWQLINVRELWKFRELGFFLIWRDVKVRYKQTMLGAAWAVIQPAMMMVVLTLFFNRTAGVSTGDIPSP